MILNGHFIYTPDRMFCGRVEVRYLRCFTICKNVDFMSHFIWPNKADKIKRKIYRRWVSRPACSPATKLDGELAVVEKMLHSSTYSGGNHSSGPDQCDHVWPKRKWRRCQLAAKYIKCQPLPPNYQMTWQNRFKASSSMSPYKIAN